jgi:hypothetical protein
MLIIFSLGFLAIGFCFGGLVAMEFGWTKHPKVRGDDSYGEGT